MPPHRLVLVRHGESWWNREGRFQGQGGTGLTERGRAQATATAAYLSARAPAVVGVVRSDLQRVAETAQPALESVLAPVTVSAAWREIDVGWWSGRTHDEVAVEDPEGYAAWRRGQDRPRGGGETYEVLGARVRSALAEAADAHPVGTVVVFTHGGCVLAAAALALGGPPGPPGPRSRLADPANCSLTTIEGGAGSWRLVAYNETAHLRAID